MVEPATPSATKSGSAAATGPESLTDLEREVLEEYAKLLGNLNEVRPIFCRVWRNPLICAKLSPLLADLSTTPTAAVLDGLRMLERKTSLVSTLLKASVYSIVLQQQMLEGEEEQSEEKSEGESR